MPERLSKGIRRRACRLADQGAAEAVRGMGRRALEPRIHWFTLQREHTEHALVDAPQWLLADKTLDRFDPERELACS